MGSIEANVRAAEANVKAADEKQVTERFSKAVELLGSNKLEVRLGGIYALERIAKDSVEKDYWTIIEVLTGFVQERTKSRWEKEKADTLSSTETKEGQTSPQIGVQAASTEASEEKNLSSPPSTDIQAVLTVLNRRTQSYRHGEKYPLNLSGSDFSWMNFSWMKLGGVSFKKMNLSVTNFQRSCGAEAWDC